MLSVIPPFHFPRRASYVRTAPPGPLPSFSLSATWQLKPFHTYRCKSSSAAIMLARRCLGSSSSSSLAPPPSPIPTGKGSRSAAVDDRILSDYLDKATHIPDLALPESLLAATAHGSTPEAIAYGSIKTRDGEAIRRMLRSAKEFGVFRISGVGVSADELRSIVTEAESIFQVWKKGKATKEFGGNRYRVSGNREEFVWLGSEEEMADWAEEALGCKTYQSFSKKMGKVASILHELAEELGLVWSENKGWRAQGIRETEPVLSLYRYNHDSLMDDIPPFPTERSSAESGYHALTLHLPLQLCKFQLQSPQGSLSFHASPGSAVATVGEQLYSHMVQEWSQEGLKSVSSELILSDSELQGSQASFSVVLKCSPLGLNHGLNKITKMCAMNIRFTVSQANASIWCC